MVSMLCQQSGYEVHPVECVVMVRVQDTTLLVCQSCSRYWTDKPLPADVVRGLVGPRGWSR